MGLRNDGGFGTVEHMAQLDSSNVTPGQMSTASQGNAGMRGGRAPYGLAAPAIGYGSPFMGAGRLGPGSGSYADPGGLTSRPLPPVAGFPGVQQRPADQPEALRSPGFQPLGVRGVAPDGRAVGGLVEWGVTGGESGAAVSPGAGGISGLEWGGGGVWPLGDVVPSHGALLGSPDRAGRRSKRNAPDHAEAHGSSGAVQQELRKGSRGRPSSHRPAEEDGMADEEAATSMAPAGGLGRSSSANALQANVPPANEGGPQLLTWNQFIRKTVALTYEMSPEAKAAFEARLQAAMEKEKADKHAAKMRRRMGPR